MISKLIPVLITGILFLHAPDGSVNNLAPLSVQGTWKLYSGTTITKGDTVVTDYTKGQQMIKIINKTHFAFMRHDLTNGKEANPVFEAGGDVIRSREIITPSTLTIAISGNGKESHFNSRLVLKMIHLFSKGWKKWMRQALTGSSLKNM